MAARTTTRTTRKEPQARPSTRWLVRKRECRLLDLARAIYDHHALTTGDTWWKMAKRAKLSGNVVQRFLDVGGIQKAQTGRTLSNVEAIFEAMDHHLVAVPSVLQPLVQDFIDRHYAMLDAQDPSASTPQDYPDAHPPDL